MGLCPRTRSPWLNRARKGFFFPVSLVNKTLLTSLQVEPRTSLPLYCIGLSTIISLLLALINIGSTKAFNALISLVVSSYYSSFVVSAGCFLHKKLTTPEAEMAYGPFTLGRASYAVIILALIYSIIGIFFSFWPPASHVTAETMNWSVVVFGGVLLFSLLFWALYGRKVYTGPVVEIATI